jgi:citronellol/citronellal dehydrogenase
MIALVADARTQVRSDVRDSTRVDAGRSTPAQPHSEVFAPGVLAGRVALVTGGGTGLGKATAIELVRCGARVMIMGRRADVLEQAVADIYVESGRRAAGEALAGEKVVGGAAGEKVVDGAAGEKVVDGAAGEKVVGGEDVGGGGAADRWGGVVEWVEGDVRDRGDAERIVQETLARRGRLDILVNNAGGQYFTPAEAIVAKGWRAVWRLNVEGLLNMAEAAAQTGIGADGSGAIVNVTLSPHHGMPGMAHSGAARAAVEALTREQARRWADRGVCVTAVAAGHFDTEAMGKYPDTVRAGMARSVPLQRLGRPEEHAWLVALLCSPVGRTLNGSTITLDGARDNWFGPWPPPGLTGETGEVPSEARRTGAP